MGSKQQEQIYITSQQAQVLTLPLAFTTTKTLGIHFASSTTKRRNPSPNTEQEQLLLPNRGRTVRGEDSVTLIHRDRLHSLPATDTQHRHHIPTNTESIRFPIPCPLLGVASGIIRCGLLFGRLLLRGLILFLCSIVRGLLLFG